MNKSIGILTIVNEVVDHLLNKGSSWDDYTYLLGGSGVVSDYGVDHKRLPRPRRRK